jgi:hypothetical protein
VFGKLFQSEHFLSFEMKCDVQQNMVSATERPSVRINIKKSYDDGNLTAGTIGIIVGVVVAVILAVIAVALLVFAKSSGRWCFADDEEAYRKPQEAKPRTAGGQPGQSAQVYRFIQLHLLQGEIKASGSLLTIKV